MGNPAFIQSYFYSDFDSCATVHIPKTPFNQTCVIDNNYGRLAINSNRNDNLQKTYMIVNSLGQIVFLKITSDDTIEIDFSNNPFGIYYLMVSAKSQYVDKIKFVYWN